MEEEWRRYNEFRASQQNLTTLQQYVQKPNFDTEQSDFRETQASSESWKPWYSSTKRSGEANEP